MSNISQFLGRGSVGSPIMTRVFLKSGIFTATKNGIARLTAAGAGASGGAARGPGVKATGGSAAGYVPGIAFPVRVGDQWIITMGAPGAGVSSGALNVAINGLDGGSTTIVGPGINVTIHGGKGGRAALADVSLLADVPGGAVDGCPGAQGGPAGGADFVSTSNASATGGGAVNLLGVDPASISSGVARNTSLGATGGASPGGGSADSFAGRTATGGGGAGGPSVDINGGPGVEIPDFISLLNDLFSVTGAGEKGSTSAASSPPIGPAGSGSGGLCGTSAMPITTGNSGAFAGSGGAATLSSAISATSGSAGYGAGSGGAACAGSGTATSGKGGDAIVIIEEF